jgi:hypothetical protein
MMSSGTMRWIILSGWFLALVTAIAIIGTSLGVLVAGREVPQLLSNWGGIALGFIFGNVSLSSLKSYIQTAPAT